MNIWIGIDIGGTKCAVLAGTDEGEILEKIRFGTAGKEETIAKILAAAEQMKAEYPGARAVGISCGGPLDAARGVILCPPNLPGWIDVPIVENCENALNLPTFLCNDANACALAEWKHGAGRGTKHMIFLTFGTGLGAGLILNGALYEGANGNGGEIGHLRLRARGPVGFGKAGSFEGFCSGGGIARQGIAKAKAVLAAGGSLPYCRSEEDLPKITAKLLADYAREGEPIAKSVYDTCAERLGEGLSLLVDAFNPERIVIGSVFARTEDLLRGGMEKVMRRECIPESLAACRVVAAELGDAIGDLAALTVASEGFRK